MNAGGWLAPDDQAGFDEFAAANPKLTRREAYARYFLGDPYGRDPVAAGVMARIRRAVDMTADCRDVDYCWQAPAATRYTARLWCNAIGEDVIGYGPDAWTAVQAAHALRDMAEEGRYRPNA